MLGGEGVEGQQVGLGVFEQSTRPFGRDAGELVVTAASFARPGAVGA